MMEQFLYVSSLTICLTSCLAFPAAGQGEYCGWEVFAAKCADDEMIVMTNATYGRMRMGRCVQRDFGFLGCSKSVLSTVHRFCSGRASCDFTVSTLHGDHNCPQDLNAYLQAQYSCVKVVSCEASQCRKPEKSEKPDFLTLTTPSGFLSSEITWRTGCGTMSCPWLIEAEKGQRINITLYDFSQGAIKDSKLCYKYATIQEANSVTKDVTVCPDTGLSLETHVLLSSTNRVSIYIYTAAGKEERNRFALKYNVLGCPELSPPKFGTVKKDGAQVTITCNHTDISWTLLCNGNAWVGEIGSCYNDAMATGGLLSDAASQTFGMLVIVGLGVGIGVVVGGLLLAVSLIYLGRRRRAQANQQLTETRLLDNNGIYSDTRYIRDTNKMAIPMAGVKHQADFPAFRDHKYSINAPIRQVSCRPCDSHPGQHLLEDEAFPPPPPEMIKDHIYETPSFPFHDMSNSDIRTHSVDGIARKMDFEEGRSNRTN